ncbi:MAG: PDZ domain-containing protein [Elusimicrobiota bacterium]|jgi:S1-C subfamily serine protease
MTSLRQALLSGTLLIAVCAAGRAAVPSGGEAAQTSAPAAAEASAPPSAGRKSSPARVRPAAAKRKAAKSAAPAKRPAIQVPDMEKRRPAPRTEAAAPAAAAGLAPLGAVTADQPAGLKILSVVAGSEADAMGLTPGDRLTHLFSSPVRTRSDILEKMRAMPAQGRLSAVVVRDLGTQSLSGKPTPFVPAALRGPNELSTHEILLKEKRLASVHADAYAAVANAPPQEFRVAAGQGLWIRFPKGIPSSAGPGDTLQAEATTGVCTDQSLDYMSLPPKTMFWAKVLDAGGPAGTHNLRLFFYKMRLPGGSSYPLSGRVADLSGTDPRLVKLTPGGTIVMPNDAAIDSDAKFKLEFIEPVTLVEPPSFYAAGVGLWIKSREDGPGFKISHIIPGRAAAAAGLQPGDVIMSIDGSKASNFDFAAAVSALYGRQESDVKIGVVRLIELESSRPKTETLVLKRGVSLASGEALPLPPPYVR